MTNLKYWIWLSESGISAQARLQLLNSFGSPEAIYSADETALRMTKILTPRQLTKLRNHELAEADRILSRCTQLGIRILTLQDDHYPNKLKNIYDPPTLLYLQGHLPALDDLLTIAVVGTRQCTPYGIRCTHMLTCGLAAGGAVIISGLATGIDSAAAKGTLQAGGIPIGVLGNGLDVCYPRNNEGLYRDVAAVGALISEYPPGTRPIGSHFPVRNRIMSGLSTAVLVVEAPEGSGSLITANAALEQGRDVFAVPGPIDAPTWKGSNALIRDGAGLVADPWDLLQGYAALYPGSLRQDKCKMPPSADQQTPPQERDDPSAEEPPASAAAPERQTDVPQAEPQTTLPTLSLSDTKLHLTEDQAALLQALTGEPQDVDTLVEKTALPAHRLLSALTMLELEHLVTLHAGKRYSRAVSVTD